MRHAETTEENTSNPCVIDGAPYLTNAGCTAITQLADRLVGFSVAAIFTSSENKSQKTGITLLRKLGSAAFLSANSPKEVAAGLRKFPNQVVVVVSDKDKIPVIIKDISNQQVTVADNEYGKVFVVLSNCPSNSRSIEQTREGIGNLATLRENACRAGA